MAFQIPGARLLEEILAGLPTNSRQAIQLREFATQMEALRKENDELKAQISALHPKHEMLADTAKVLKLFFDADRKFSSKQTAAKFEMTESMAKYHLGVLEEKHFILSDMVVYADSPVYYAITQEGRDFIVKRGMA
jgi:hypothetical protein